MMSEITLNKVHYLNRLHEGLEKAGGTAADYIVEGGGYDPGTGELRPDFLRVSTEIINQGELESIVNAHNSMSVESDKPSILADDTDTATITCSDEIITNDTAVDYAVWVDGQLYTEPVSAAISNGQVQFSLKTIVPGTYLVEIKRQGAGNYESGYAEIVAQEVSE